MEKTFRCRKEEETRESFRKDWIFTPEELRKAEEERLARLTPEQRKAALEEERWWKEHNRREQERLNEIAKFEESLSPVDREIRNCTHAIAYNAIAGGIPGVEGCNRIPFSPKFAIKRLIAWNRIIVRYMRKLIELAGGEDKVVDAVRRVMHKRDIIDFEITIEAFEKFKRREPLASCSWRVNGPIDVEEFNRRLAKMYKEELSGPVREVTKKLIKASRAREL